MTENDPAELFKRARSIAEGALALAEEERGVFITSSCGDDEALRSQVDQLLSNAKTSDSFLAETVLSDTHDASRGAMPQEVGRYKIRRVIGAGGMGMVYEAVQQSPRRTVALKMIKHGVTSRSALRRFAYEAQTLGRLHHEGIAQIYEADTYNDGSGEVPWFAMEYIAGAKPLTTYANEKGLGTRERLALFMKICDAINHGHQKGIIHRDLKPGNILVDVNGQPKIIDYGIARATDSDMAVTTLQTDVGQLLGTVQYMSPEQCAADPDILDTRSDVYSLGVILYELLCDALPYDLESVPVFEAARVIREQTPNRPSTINRTLRGDIETIVLKALQKDRAQRYQSAHELQQDIQRYLNSDPITARPPSITYQLKIFARRNKGLFISAAVIATVLVAATVVSIVLAVSASRSAAEARAAEADVLEKQNRLQASQRFLIHVLSIPTPSVAQGRDLDHEDLLNIAGEDVDEWFEGMPGYQDDHHALIGYFMVKMNMHDEAEKHLLPALAKLEARHGRDHYKTQFTLITMAMMRNGQGHPRDAEELSAEVEAWVRKKDTWDPMDIEFLIYRLEILDELNRWPEVISLAEEVLEETQDVRFDIAMDGFTQEEIELRIKGLWGRNLMRLCQLQQDPELRQQMFEQSHDLMGEVVETGSALSSMGPRHPVTLKSATDLKICRWAANMGETLEAVDRAIEEVEMVHGEDSPLAMQYEISKGSILGSKAQYTKSEEILSEVLESLQDQMDPDHPSVQIAKLYLGRTLANQGKFEEAEPLLRESNRVLSERLEPHHLEVIMTRGLYGMCLIGTGRLDEGAPYLDAFVAALEELLGPAHREPLSIRLFAIGKRFKYGNHEEALRLMQAFLLHSENVLPEGDESLIRFQTVHGDMLRDMERHERANEVFEQAYANALEFLSAGLSARWAAMSDLQDARLRSGNTEGALAINDQILIDAQAENGRHMDSYGWGLGGRLKILKGTNRQIEVDQLLEEALSSGWDSALHMNNLAWGIATDPDHEHARTRYPDQMLRAARRACELTANREPNYLDTLARVHFVRGELDAAITTQERAVELVPADEVEAFQNSLDEYRKNLANPDAPKSEDQ